jgi:tetratricopeptide (TPR) repeat protein
VKRTRSIPPARTITPARRRWFLTITLLFPVAVFVLLEGTLRLAHYGPDLSLFMTETLAGRPYLVMNPAVKGRYFSRVLFSPSTSPDYFSAHKSPGTFRIFCLGGSTTVGYPYWYNGSFSSFLRDRLHRIFPDRPVEIINIGMTATNSFTVNDMAREVMEYEPDLLIVYDGHNEFYGALGVASNESPGRSRWISRLSLRAVHWKTFLLLRDILGSVRGVFAASGPGETGATMMERLASGQRVPYGGELYAAGLETYRANLGELKEICSAHGTPVLLGSQASNLRDLSPFISEPPPGLSAAGRAALDSAFSTGRRYQSAGAWALALAAFGRASVMAPNMADAHYQLARCLDTLGRRREAEAEYIRARDTDQLRFRMSSEFNEAMRAACSTPGSVFVDMEDTFRRNSPDSLIGSSLIVEHVHPNARGYFLIARAYATAMRRQGLLAPAEEWARCDTLDERRLWNDRCLTEIDDRMARRRTEILMSGWPFRAAVPLVDAVPRQDTLGQIVERVTRGQWNWLQAHNAAAAYYLGRGEPSRAAAEYRTIINQLPLLDVAPWLTLAKLCIDASQLEEARQALEGSLRVQPTILAYRALGDISLRAGQPARATEMYRKTFMFQQSAPERVENGYLLALALSREGKADEAVSELLKVLALRPDFQPAAKLLAEIRGGAGK